MFAAYSALKKEEIKTFKDRCGKGKKISIEYHMHYYFLHKLFNVKHKRAFIYFHRSVL